MLDKIFSSSYNLSEKKRHLTEECGIALTDTINEGVDGMCNYSDYVFECGEEQGKKIGYKECLLESIRKLMKRRNFSAEQAMEDLDVSPKEQAELLPLV